MHWLSLRLPQCGPRSPAAQSFFIRRFLLQFFVLFGDGFIAGILMPVSHITLTPLGMCLYTIDALGKCAVVILASLIRSSCCKRCFDEKMDRR
jgi:hypothetical protein